MQFIGRAADAMSAYQQSLDTLGENLGQIQTRGYRARRTSFVEAARGGVATRVDVLQGQGALESTHQVTDLALDGSGLFVIQGPSGQMYTRDGSFHLDSQGRLLCSGQNLEVMGYGVDAHGQVDYASGLVPVRIPVGQPAAGQGSGTIHLGGTLDATAATYVPAAGTVPESGGVAHSKVTLYDSLGVAHAVSVDITKTGTNTWAWKASLDASDTSTLSAASGQITFGGDGRPTSASPTLVLDPASGANAGQSVTLDVSQLSQVAGQAAVTAQADGFTTGTLSSFTVGTDGIVTGQYTTGGTTVLGQLALARFADPGSLKQAGDNLMVATDTSGSAQIGLASQGGFGTVQQGSLEGSNIDVTVEYAKMMLSQRAYQANSQLMKIGDEMWQQLMAVRQ